MTIHGPSRDKQKVKVKDLNRDKQKNGNNYIPMTFSSNTDKVNESINMRW